MDDAASANRHAARLVGTSIYQLRVARALTLDFESDARLVIETPLSAHSTAGVWQGEPADGGAIDVLLPLLDQRIESARVSTAGSIRLTFASGAIEVGPHPEYESWQLATPDTRLVICMPGGGLESWQ
ncbi:DUF6188 family protein [Cellulosimicrobium cellulans]|uniref:DUF6188 family protein n=1 Tax=Cellulosimicrobium cellulans TaxID=1710 RepID=UPI0020CC3424|nr:DUF6188 family protein [Cellulosimicrobium cellulans]